ncbi:MAG: hypothetical protein WCO90_12700 [Planctomycetota bacterium]
MAITSFSCVQVEEQFLCYSAEGIVTDVVRFAPHDLLEQQTGGLVLFRVAPGLERANKVADGAGH